MKPIEGQLLLSIQQYFPIDYIRMAKKNEAMMNLFIENIAEKVKKGIMDCYLDSSTLEINNHTKPLFTLTAEEVEFLNYTLYWLLDERYFDNDEETSQARNLLTRINQWQDENNRTD